MRLLLAVWLLASCVSEQLPSHRPMVVDNVPYGANLIRYDDRGWSVAYAVFAPVPCTMQGRCDQVVGHRWVAADRELIEPGVGLYLDPSDRGRAIDRSDTPVPDMQDRMYSALRAEIDSRLASRHVVPTWKDSHGFGATWETPNTKLGLFVSSNGAWIVETHEVKPQFLDGTAYKLAQPSASASR